jgi:signal transduction histidine kinase
VSTGVPDVARSESAPDPTDGEYAYSAALPVLGEGSVLGALVVVGEARDPFTVLDNRFLHAFGQQVGAALANHDLHRHLTERTAELERLQARMVHQHEEERKRIWRELHDETAQVLAALNLQLGVVAERSAPEMAPAVDRARTLLGQGIQSIRSVTRNLRPLPLDDLGLLPALRALARDFDDADAVRVTFHGPEVAPRLGPHGESTLYRATQEGVSNAVRHGARELVEVRLEQSDDEAVLTVQDDGPGFAADASDRLRSLGGLTGIRERVSALGGHFSIGNSEGGGARLTVALPIAKRTSDEDEATHE